MKSSHTVRGSDQVPGDLIDFLPFLLIADSRSTRRGKYGGTPFWWKEGESAINAFLCGLCYSSVVLIMNHFTV